ncbi:hypothetical protein ACOSQ3_001389 [Xanthoceras sorbifolium]
MNSKSSNEEKVNIQGIKTTSISSLFYSSLYFVYYRNPSAASLQSFHNIQERRFLVRHIQFSYHPRA